VRGRLVPLVKGTAAPRPRGEFYGSVRRRREAGDGVTLPSAGEEERWDGGGGGGGGGALNTEAQAEVLNERCRLQDAALLYLRFFLLFFSIFNPSSKEASSRPLTNNTADKARKGVCVCVCVCETRTENAVSVGSAVCGWVLTT